MTKQEVLDDNSLVNDSPAEFARMRHLVWLSSVIFAVVVFWDAAMRWATFRYATFDLAFYVQALWKLVHGDAGVVSLLNVPLMGEHANVIVLAMAPFFAIIQHPLLPIALQTIAIASMGPTAFRIARKLGLDADSAGVMAVAALLAPAAGFVALHEFHPEGFTPAFLLLGIEAFISESLGAFWFWFLATLACKENMTLLLATWCFVNFWKGRRKGAGWIVSWCVLPGLVALGWAAVFMFVLTPKLNNGNIDFTALYSHLAVPVWQLPGAIVSHLGKSVCGDLLYGLVLPLCGLSLLRPRWMLVALPVLGQHLLSIRSSEWQIEYHYAAPLIPLFWIAACETVSDLWSPRPLAVAVGLGCVVTQIWMGPLRIIVTADRSDNDAAEKRMIVKSIAPKASVVAGLPFLSHLAEREELVSLHHVLKGLRTLSRKRWIPPAPTDVVVVDYSDRATFNTVAGYYHPQMKMVSGAVIPSSDVLLSDFLKRASWKVEAHNSITVYRKLNAAAQQEAPLASETGAGQEVGEGNRLVDIKSNATHGGSVVVKSVWRFHGVRKIIPWMSLVLSPIDGSKSGGAVWLTRGLCVPEGSDNGQAWTDNWSAELTGRVPQGKFRMRAVFYDNSEFAWCRMQNRTAPLPVLDAVDLGVIEVR